MKPLKFPLPFVLVLFIVTSVNDSFTFAQITAGAIIFIFDTLCTENVFEWLLMTHDSGAKRTQRGASASVAPVFLS